MKSKGHSLDEAYTQVKDYTFNLKDEDVNIKAAYCSVVLQMISEKLKRNRIPINMIIITNINQEKVNNK